MSKITQIRVNNFTSFSNLDQGFSSGVNVVIGANGTGKTHLLKILYAACAITAGEDKEKGRVTILTHPLCNFYELFIQFGGVAK